MFSRILAIFSISLVFTEIAESSPALGKATRQLLSGSPGFIPVYIRPGETPLEEINPELAEAFNFYAQKYGRVTFGRSIGDKSDSTSIKSRLPESVKFSDIDMDSLDNEITNIEESKDKKSSNIQKIPKE